MYARLYGSLRIKTIGRVLREYPSLDSTNRVARELAASGEAEGIVIIAHEQTAGRGRLGRDWHSPLDGGLYLSTILRPEASELAARERIATAVGVAIMQVLRRHYQIPAELKWPNDVLIHGKKVSGILIEAGNPNELVVGIGININWPALPRNLDAYRTPPTALSLELGGPVDEQELLKRLLESLDLVYRALRRGLFRAILGRARRHLHGRGREVAFDDGFGVRRTGLLEDLDDEGRALIRLPDRRLIAITAGELTCPSPSP